MEKAISPEERIRRAEEIYYRRKLKNGNVRMSSSQVTEKAGERQISLYKKMILQILICVLIYLVFSLIKEANYIFSENVINKTKELLSTDINFSVISGQVEQFFKNNQSFFENWLHSEDENKEKSNQKNVNQNHNNQINSNSQNQENTNLATQQNNNEKTKKNEQNSESKTQNNEIKNEESNTNNQEPQNNEQTSQMSSDQNNYNNQTTGIGGSSTNKNTLSRPESTSTKKTQMQIDAEYIKDNFQMQLPVKGEVTSNYGKREPTEIISENHQGIDIGVVVGTTIVASMQGKVSVVSDKGDYGTHVKIVNKDITTIYAHCSQILVKEGDNVKKGQKIALSGNTGNSTGPHLHFEIRRNERTVDPAMVLNWN